MMKIAVPNKGALAEVTSTILREAGYATRRDSKALNVVDHANGVEFFYLRPKDIAIYVASGKLDLGITGRDLALDSRAEVHEVLTLGFGRSTFRFAAPLGSDWTVEGLEGRTIASAYPNLVRDYLERQGVNATVIRLDGAVEISIRLGVADVIADVVSTGATLRTQGLEPFGEPICQSEAVVVAGPHLTLGEDHEVILRRFEGIVHAHNYLMLDYNIPRQDLEAATAITPGLSGPTVSPLATPDWVAVRAMIPQADANSVMDRLSALGAQAILASDLRIARI
ncbi:ATP phosphoribosyltransferase [Corynebacterium uberis]|uniref:ATP phosphoribosyltransferase n=1 Tax=Corynebacterium TaxID=1716 RepID=UPI001D0ACDBC|nr:MULTISPECIES: ATP phosphoribosyltransferase [Corynebacterium]MCZ9308651.1 ATP phosphoribosyltransferase [Corynebacterium sp. c6VSa_13]UDL74291.1 ATP phosphoribosyltransferase [Corynebacterium uberis]UDL76876.1 ATP phosphoribosyltransferase [Corynebacterium uberis]UDL79089.1 ATP phosphoribosyltransferase [Corynebacterium uberis]UDL79327.1 ATP phosphoribosyltransferase [Corynebacterium uberis]